MNGFISHVMSIKIARSLVGCLFLLFSPVGCQFPTQSTSGSIQNSGQSVSPSSTSKFSRSPIPSSTRQLITAISSGWESPRATLQRWTRQNARSPWQPVSRKIPVLLGRKGSAWGRGLSSPMRSYAPKREGDGKAPAGAFRLGDILGNDLSLPSGSNYPYRQITKWDTWIDDVNNPFYNQHVVIDPRRVPSWYESQKMRLGDFAYRWLVDIRHNRDRPIAGAGSAIFFHVRRGPNRFTSGCTTMAEHELAKLVRWLRKGAKPVYVLLPRQEYTQLASSWGLPPH